MSEVAASQTDPAGAAPSPRCPSSRPFPRLTLVTLHLCPPPQAFVYMCFHAAMCLALLAWGTVSFFNFQMHTAFLLTMIMISAWNGSGYYNHKMLKAVEKGLQQAMSDDDKKK